MNEIEAYLVDERTTVQAGDLTPTYIWTLEIRMKQ